MARAAIMRQTGAAIALTTLALPHADFPLVRGVHSPTTLSHAQSERRTAFQTPSWGGLPESSFRRTHPRCRSQRVDRFSQYHKHAVDGGARLSMGRRASLAQGLLGDDIPIGHPPTLDDSPTSREEGDIGVGDGVHATGVVGGSKIARIRVENLAMVDSIQVEVGTVMRWPITHRRTRGIKSCYPLSCHVAQSFDKSIPPNRRDIPRTCVVLHVYFCI